jgi:hypothetical protein
MLGRVFSSGCAGGSRRARNRVEQSASCDGNTDDAQLRLITCGGAFDDAARSYEDNVIVFATLVGTRPA